MVDVNPPITSTTGASVYSLNETAISVLNGIYIRLAQGNSIASGTNSISLLGGLSADEFTLDATVSNTDYKNYYYTNTLFANATIQTPGTENWGPLYNYIFVCNDAIEGLDRSTSLLPTVKNQLLGESKFVRALSYFYLVNLYGDVPLATSTDYKINTMLYRSSKEKVYEQIVSDLKDAQSLLSEDFLDGNLLQNSVERVRPTKWAATALLARVYLYTNENANAEVQATSIINNATLFSLTPLNEVFLKNSKEAIWQLQPVNSGWNTEDARIFILDGGPNSDHPVYLSNSVIDEFEANDQRKIPGNWVNVYSDGAADYYYPNKYKSATYGNPVTEYTMVFRLAEQYLIRAESKAKQRKLNEALTDLNLIRNRAGLSDTSAADMDSALKLILHERKSELFSEWGHRWLDLKRTGQVDSIMNIQTPLKVGAGLWQSFQQWYPLPADQIQINANLVQNEGY